MRALSIAATGMTAQQRNVETIANNVANVATTGFKRSNLVFQDLMYQPLRRQGSLSSDAGTMVPAGVEIGLGVKPAAVTRIVTQGSLQQTGNSLDIAIEGKGYLTIQLPNGENAYTRAGALQRSAEGQLVTVDGYEVAPGITIPADAREVVISKSGQVLAYENQNSTPTEVGRIQLSNFVNEPGLEALGDNLFRETPASGQPNNGFPGDPGFGSVRQGYVESSNVNVVEEITSLIQAQRAYEMNSKVIEAGDEMSKTATGMR